MRFFCPVSLRGAPNLTQRLEATVSLLAGSVAIRPVPCPIVRGIPSVGPENFRIPEKDIEQDFHETIGFAPQRGEARAYRRLNPATARSASRFAALLLRSARLSTACLPFPIPIWHFTFPLLQ